MSTTSLRLSAPAGALASDNGTVTEKMKNEVL